jgi:hypothetical protein
MSDISITTITEKQLEAIFYKNYRDWEKKFREWISDKTDRQMSIMEPVFFSWDKDIDIHKPHHDTSQPTITEEKE